MIILIAADKFFVAIADAKKLLLILKLSLLVTNTILLADKVLVKIFLLQKDINLKFLIPIFFINKIILDFVELQPDSVSEFWVEFD